jgi:3-oxoacyl-[acyl-carrier protein] reductase
MRNAVKHNNSLIVQSPSRARSKVALVTGGSRGLGKEVSLRLAGIGYNVAVNFIKESSHAARVMKYIRSDALAVRAEVADLDQVQDMAEDINQKWGRLDLLVNNAGITRDNLLIRATEEEWDEVMDTNLRGCFNTVKVFTPLLMKMGGGHIVNISSRTGLTGKAGQAAYSASKAALIGLTRSLASELGRYNIRVNAVLPGYMPTDMGEKATTAIKRASQKSLLARLSDPAEVASFIAWLSGTEGITGQVFCLDSRI